MAIEQFAEADVVVVGSGSAGATAAIAAARWGARTLLLERYGFLGGTSTQVLDTFYGFYTPGERAIKVVGGIADDVVAALKAHNACFERPNTYGAGTGVTYHAEYLKVVWERLALAAGVRVLMHCWVQDAVREGERVAGLIVATKRGLVRIGARVIIDASGDADVCHYAGVPYETAGDEAAAQTMTTTFRMCNVDMDRRRTVTKDALHAAMRDAAEHGGYDLPRREGSDHATPVPGVTATVMTRVPASRRDESGAITATDPEFLTAAEIEGRRQALEYARFLHDRVPGYESAHLAALSTQIGVRESRRVHGEYRLTRDDVLSARQFDDQIGLCGAPIEDHAEGEGTTWQYLPEGRCVGIPLRTLIPRGVENMLVAGRCFSATHDAHASVRSMAQCMAMGQAAGTTAALAIERGIEIAAVPVAELRERLVRAGAMVELP